MKRICCCTTAVLLLLLLLLLLLYCCCTAAVAIVCTLAARFLLYFRGSVALYRPAPAITPLLRSCAGSYYGGP